MKHRKIRGHSRRWWFFVGVALLVHGVLVVAITYREAFERPEPVLSGKFVKRRPLQQPYLERRVERPVARPVLKRSVTASRPYARSAVQYVLTPVHPSLLGTRFEVPSLPPRPVSFARGLPSSGRLRSPPAEVSVQAPDHLDLGWSCSTLSIWIRALPGPGGAGSGGPPQPGRIRALFGGGHSSVRRLEGENWGPWTSQVRAHSVDRETAIFPDLRHSANIRALASLAAEVEEQTGLKATVDENLDLPSPAVLESPFILLTSGRPFEPSAVEAEQLGRYLVSGGFAYVEQVGAPPQEVWNGTSAICLLRDLIRMALATQGLTEGTDWTFEPWPSTIPCFTVITTSTPCRPTTGGRPPPMVYGYKEGPPDRGTVSSTVEGIPPYLEAST